MTPNQVTLKRTIIGINNSFSQKQLKRIVIQLGVDKAKAEKAEIPLVSSKSKNNLIKLAKEKTLTGKVAFYFFVYRKRLNFICEKADENEELDYTGFRAYKNAIKEADTKIVKQFEEKITDRGFKNQKLERKFQDAISLNECYEMDYVEEIYEKNENDEPEEKNPDQSEEIVPEEKKELKLDNAPPAMNKIDQPKPRNGTPMRKPTTNFDIETPIKPSNQTFNEMLNVSIGAPELANTKRFNNQYIRKITLDEYNFDKDSNRNPNDWLANAIFCLTLEDRLNKMNDGEKISSLMRALKGNLKDTLFAKLREIPDNDLTLQKFQELFTKHTTKSIREIENRLAKVSKDKAGSYQDLYMQINNLIVEQMMVSGVTKDHLNKEVIQAMTERLFKKKCHQNSETFQTTSKKGQELIDLADELNELSEAKSLNTISRILPEQIPKETTAPFPENRETRTCFRCNKQGHIIGNCRAREKKQTSTPGNNQQSRMQGWGNNQQQPWQNNSQQSAWQGGRGGMNNYQQNRNQNNFVNRYAPQQGNSNFRGNYQRGENINRNWVNNRSNYNYGNPQNFSQGQGEDRRGNNRSSRGGWGNHRY